MLLLCFCYSQDFLEFNLRISHQKIQNTSKEMPEKPLSSSSLDLAESDQNVNFSAISATDASITAKIIYSYRKVPALLPD